MFKPRLAEKRSAAASRLRAAMRTLWDRPLADQLAPIDAAIDAQELAIAFLYQRVATMEFLIERGRGERLARFSSHADRPAPNPPGDRSAPARRAA